MANKKIDRKANPCTRKLIKNTIPLASTPDDMTTASKTCE